jgi:folate-binding Fe-S cluster repair protein YgfZ
MKNGIFTLIFCLLATALSAQQSVDTLISRSKVQKKIFIVRKNDPKESFKAEEKTAELEQQTDDLIKTTFRSLPKMISDKDGLLNQVYLEQSDDSTKTYKEPFAILSFTVSEFGFISKIIVHDYSDIELVDILIKKFDQTKWKAAKDSNGKNAAYTYQKIAVIMPIVIKPEDRED